MSFPLLLLRGLIGFVTLIGIAVLCSTNRRKIDWRMVAWGTGLQVLFAALVLKTAPGRQLFEFVGGLFAQVLNFTSQGSEFIFGPLAMGPGKDGSIGMIFAFQVLPTIIFFSSLMAVLYHYNVVQPVVKAMGRVMAVTLRISGAESLSAAANVFIGQTEAPLVVKPYIPTLTKSELMTLMVGGMSTIAGGVLAAYILFLGGDDPGQQAQYAAHLLSASIMSAPAAIVMAKILVPETGSPETMGQVTIAIEKTEVNGLEAAAAGAADGLKLALNVGAMLLAFIALIAMVDALLAWVGAPEIAGVRLYDFNSVVKAQAAAWGADFDGLSLKAIFGFLFAPLAWAMGVESADLLNFGRLLGEKIAVNEFVAFMSLGSLSETVSERTMIIGTYALCGFANFSSIAIQIGGIGGIAPSRRSEIAQLGVRAVIGGALASWMTATIAGVLAT